MRSLLLIAAAAASAAVAAGTEYQHIKNMGGRGGSSGAKVVKSSPISAASPAPRPWTGAPGDMNATVYITGGKFTVVTGVVDPAGVAWAQLFDMANAPSAFGELYVVTNPGFNDTAQMFAAGMCEGAVTATRIYQHYTNVNAWIVSRELLG